MTDPEKSYNLEFLSTRHYLSQQLEAMLAEHDFHPHRALRKGANTIYIKAADHIEDLLTFMGAGGAAMRIMDQRVYNEMRNKTNRLSNCETANLGKSVQAAVQVQLAIEKLQAAGAMNTLPEALRHTAKLCRNIETHSIEMEQRLQAAQQEEQQRQEKQAQEEKNKQTRNRENQKRR